MINRERAIQLIIETNPDHIMTRHILLVEAIMRTLAHELDEDIDTWGLTGLLHDFDFRETSSNLELHGQKTIELLQGAGLPENCLNAIERHNYTRDLNRTTTVDKALLAADMAAGLINAAAAIMPNKNIELLELKSLQKRFKDDKFAPGAKREYLTEFAPLVGDIEHLLKLVLNASKQCLQLPNPFPS